MTKAPYNSFLKSIKMFFVYPDIDQEYSLIVQKQVSALRKGMTDINTWKGLQTYIKEQPNSLDNLLTILGISGEVFKRVLSLLRTKRGHQFSTEWSIAAARNFMLENESMMDDVIGLFLKGEADSFLKENIPAYRLSSFLITPTVIERINNDDFLGYLVKKDLETTYNSAVSQRNITVVEQCLQDLSENSGYALNKDISLDPVGNGTRNIQVNYSICKKDNSQALFYVKYSFITTTSRGQSDFKRSVMDVRDYIKSTGSSAKQIVIVDGAGWVARQADLHDIWDYCDYCLSFKTLNDLNEIIK